MNDTICAISTPAGVGGIAVARVSGPQAIAIVDALWRGKPLADAASHTAHLGTVLDAQGQPLDQAVATVFRAPGSFTGEDVVEVSVHGSRYVQQALLHALIHAGARMAEPGEFTRRAFVSGKMDLAQAEAVADLIASQTRSAHRLAINQMRGKFSSRLHQLRQRLIDLASLLELELDFSEEDVEFASRRQLMDIASQVKTEVDALAASFHTGSAIKDGIPVAIIGATNAGKSSLLNALVGDDRAIVSDIHGTTRDVIEDTIAIGEYAFRLMDTAGLRSTSDAIEAMGIERSNQAASKSDIIIYVIDGNDPRQADMPQTDAAIIVAVNKSDLPQAPALDLPFQPAATISISAKTEQGIDQVRQAMANIAAQAENAQDTLLVTNARHYQALTNASEAITRAIGAIEANLSGDLISLDIRLTIHHLSSILGQITSQDLLNTIFTRFCIGK